MLGIIGMWLPVARTSDLRADPLSLTYLGSRVAVFRTVSGQLGALEDACAHRRVPLSKGTVRGETLRCGYHHFAFDCSGACVSAPALMELAPSVQRRCNVHRFYVREMLGLIWLSAESEPAARFPLDDTARLHTIAFAEKGGSPWTWMDHWIDGGHAVLAHSRSVYSGRPEQLASAKLEIRLSPGDSYPADGGTLRLAGPSLQPALIAGELFWNLYHCRNLGAALRRLFTPRARRDSTLEIRGSVLSPFSQLLEFRYASPHGETRFDFYTFVNPVGPGRNQLCMISFAHRDVPGLVRPLVRAQMNRTAMVAHVTQEDAPMFEAAEVVDARRFTLTPMDDTVVALREMFARYAEEKATLYPANSVIHELRAAPGARVALRAADKAG